MPIRKEYVKQYDQEVNNIDTTSDMVFNSALDDLEDENVQKNVRDVAERQQKINDRNEAKPKKKLEDTGSINEYWNKTTDFFGLDSMRTQEVKDGRIYDSRNKESGLYDNLSKQELIETIKEAPEDDGAEYILYQKKIPIGINEDGTVKFGYKNGIAKNSLWERERQLGADNGEEIMWAKRVAGAEDMESRINQLAFENKDGVFDIGESAGTKDNLGSGYTEIQKESFLDQEQFNDKAERQAFLDKDLADQAKSDKYRRDHGDDGLMNYVSAAGSGALSLTGDLADLAITGVGFVGNELGLKNDLANDNWGDRLSENADDIAMYNRRASTVAMTESANKWKNGDYVGALFNSSSLDMAESAVESLPEMAMMTLSLGTGAAAKAASVASKLNKARRSALVAGDAVKLAKTAKKEAMLFKSIDNPVLKESILANRYLSASKELLKANAGFAAVVAKNTNNVIEDRIKNGDEDVTAPEASAIFFSQLLATGMDKLAFQSTITSNPALKESIKGLVGTLSNAAKKSLTVKAGIAAASIAKEMGTEGAQEYVQTWTEIFGKDLGVKDKGIADVWNDQKNQDEALKASIAGSVAGGAMHAIPEATRAVIKGGKVAVDSQAYKDFSSKLKPTTTDVMTAETMSFDDYISDNDISPKAKYHYANTKLVDLFFSDDKAIDGKGFNTAYYKVASKTFNLKNPSNKALVNNKLSRVLINKIGDDPKKLETVMASKGMPSSVKKSVSKRYKARVNQKTTESVQEIMDDITLGSDGTNNYNSVDKEFYAEYNDNGELVQPENPNPFYGAFNDVLAGFEDDIKSMEALNINAEDLKDTHSKIKALNDSTKEVKNIEKVSAEIAESGYTIDGKKIDGYDSISEHKDNLTDVALSPDDSYVDLGSVDDFKRFVGSRSAKITKEGAKFSPKLLKSITTENKQLFEMINPTISAVKANSMLSDKKKTEILSSLGEAKNLAKDASNKASEKIFGVNFDLAKGHSRAQVLSKTDVHHIGAHISDAKTLDDIANIKQAFKDAMLYPDENTDLTYINDYITDKEAQIASGKTGVLDGDIEFMASQQYRSQPKDGEPVDDELLDDLLRSAKTEDEIDNVVDMLSARRLTYDQTKKLVRLVASPEPEKKQPEHSGREHPFMFAYKDTRQKLALLAEQANNLRRKGNKNLDKELAEIEATARSFDLSPDDLMKHYYSLIDDDIKPVSKDTLTGSVDNLISDLENDKDLNADDLRAYRDEVVEEASKTLSRLRVLENYVNASSAASVLKPLLDVIEKVYLEIESLRNKSKSQIAFAEKLSKYASDLDSGKKLHHMSIKSLKQNILSDFDRRTKTENTDGVENYGPKDPVDDGKKNDDDGKKNDDGDDGEKDPTNDGEKNDDDYNTGGEVKENNGDDNDSDSTPEEKKDSKPKKKNTTFNASAKYDTELARIESFLASNKKDDYKVPKTIKDVIRRLKVPVRRVIASLKLDNINEKNLILKHALDTLSKKFNLELEDGANYLESTIEYANNLSEKLFNTKDRIENLEASLEKKDIKFQSSKKLRDVYKKLNRDAKELFGKLENTTFVDERTSLVTELMDIIAKSVRINPNDVAIAEAFVEKYVDPIKNKAYEDGNIEFHNNHLKLNRALRYSFAGLINLVQSEKDLTDKLNSITDKYLEKRETILNNAKSRTKQLILIAKIRADIKKDGQAKIDDVVTLMERLETRDAYKHERTPYKGKVPLSIGTKSLMDHIGEDNGVVTSKPSLLSHLLDAVGLNRAGFNNRPPLIIIDGLSKSIKNSDDGYNRLDRAIELISMSKQLLDVKVFKNIQNVDGVFSMLNKNGFNASSLLTNSNGEISPMISEAIRTSAFMLAPAISDLRFSLMRYDEKEYSQYFGISDPDEIRSIKEQAVIGFVPMSFIKAEARNLMYDTLGVKPSSDLDKRSRDMLDAGMSSLVLSGVRALSGEPTVAPFSFKSQRIKGEAKTTGDGWNMVKVNMTKEDVSTLSLASNIVGKNNKAEPTLLPVKPRKKVKNGEVTLNDYDMEQLEQRNNTKWYFGSSAKAAFDLWKKEPEKLYSILGKLSDEQLEMLNPLERETALVHNESIVRFTDDLFGNYEFIGSKAFYLDNYVMRSGRTSSSGEITPFESKLQRLFLTKGSFKRELPMPKPSDKREPKDMVKNGKDDFTEIEQFEISLAGYLGVKVDGRSKFHVFEEVRKIVDIYSDNKADMLVSKEDDFKVIKDVLDNAMADGINETDPILRFENNGTNKYQFIRAVTTLGNIAKANLVDGSDTFSNELTMFADAVSSGPANIALQSGEDSSKEAILEKAGILTDEQMATREKYTKFLLSKKYGLSEDEITFNMVSLIEAGKYHSDSDTSQDIKDEASKIDEVFLDIYETSGSSLFKSMSQENVDAVASKIAEKNKYLSEALKSFRRLVLGNKDRLSFKDVRDIAKPANMVKGYGASDSSVRREYADGYVFDKFYKSANSEDKTFFESIVLSMSENELHDRNDELAFINEYLNDDKNFIASMPEDIIGKDRLPYLKPTLKLRKKFQEATNEVFADAIIDKINDDMELQGNLTDAIKSTEPIVFAMSKVILDNEVEKLRANNNGKVTKKDYVDMLDNLVQDGNGHAIYAKKRILAFNKEESIETKDGTYAIESVDDQSITDTVKTKEATSAFGGFATLYIHSKDGEAMTAGLDGTDFTSVYDEIEFPSSFDDMKSSADRYQDSIYETGKDDFSYGNIIKHVNRMKRKIQEDGLEDKLKKEFEIANISDKTQKVDVVDEQYGELSDTPKKLPLLAVIGTELQKRKIRDDKMITSNQWKTRLFSNGNYERQQSFYSTINGEQVESLRIVVLTDSTGSVIDTYALVPDMSLRDARIVNKKSVTRIGLPLNNDIGSIVDYIYNPSSKFDNIKQEMNPDGNGLDGLVIPIVGSDNDIASIHDLKNDYLVRSGFSTGYDNAAKTLFETRKAREELYQKDLNIAHLNTLGVDFKKMENKTEPDNVSDSDIFEFLETYSSLQKMFQDNIIHFDKTVYEFGEDVIPDSKKLNDKAGDLEEIIVDDAILDIISEYITDKDKGC